MGSKNEKPFAILDSSFYIHLVKINLIMIFLDFYKIMVCSKVKDEITYFLYKDLYVPKDIELFLKLEALKIITIENPKIIPSGLINEVSKNSGESYSIALAQEKNVIVFIDNGRPYNYCLKNKILCSNIIEFLLYLYKIKIITKKEILQKIKIIENSLPKEYLLEIYSKME
jgi:predicted nucleic acid-binding protein